MTRVSGKVLCLAGEVADDGWCVNQRLFADVLPLRNTMIRSKTLAFSCCVLGCLLILGCSTSEPTNVAGNASQAEIDNYNKLIQQAENDLSGDSEQKDFED